MDLKTYQEQTGRTAIYKPELAPHYLLPGILVEALELQLAPTHMMTKKEIGDVMWFTSQIHTLAGFDMIYTGPTTVSGISRDYAILRIIRQSQMAADMWVKIVRDRDGVWGAGDLDPLVFPLREVPFWCSKLAEGYGGTLENILEENIAKLKDRQQRGVLGGSGDDR